MEKRTQTKSISDEEKVNSKALNGKDKDAKSSLP